MTTRTKYCGKIKVDEKTIYIDRINNEKGTAIKIKEKSHGKFKRTQTVIIPISRLGELINKLQEIR